MIDALVTTSLGFDFDSMAIRGHSDVKHQCPLTR